jgi:hypothetical protein
VGGCVGVSVVGEVLQAPGRALPPALLGEISARPARGSLAHALALAPPALPPQGAHEGLGLGHEFLRHVQRCQALVHVIDGTSKDPLGDYHAINLELELFNPELRGKPQVRCGCVCGGWCVVCGVWCVVVWWCGVWCVVCGVWCVVCGVWCVVWWCVVCGVWCVVCGVLVVVPGAAPGGRLYCSAGLAGAL